MLGARASTTSFRGCSCRVIRKTASRKATGPDEVPAERFKAGGEESTGHNAQNMCGDLGNW